MSEKTPKNDSWIETREYPGSRLQLIPFLVMMILAVVFFLLFSKGEISISGFLPHICLVDIQRRRIPAVSGVLGDER